MQLQPLTLSLLIAGSLTALPACQSRITGNEGNLEFSYSTVDDIGDFNKPIAVGAKLDLRVKEAGTHRDVSLQSAESDHPDVLAVVSNTSDLILLEGAGSGEARISVEAKVPNGDVVTDSVDMQARVPDVVELNHVCTNEPEARYFVDQDITVHFDMKMSNGRNVIGYGYHPVTVEPADGLAIDQTTKAQEFLHFHTAAAPQTVALKADIGSAALDLVLVTEAMVDGAELDETGTRTPILVDNLRFLNVRPTVGGKRICMAQASGFTAVTSTPDICEVDAGSRDDDSPEDTLEPWGIVRVKGKAVGWCDFVVTYPAGNDGAGVEATFRAEIAELDRPTE